MLHVVNGDTFIILPIRTALVGTPVRSFLLCMCTWPHHIIISLSILCLHLFCGFPCPYQFFSFASSPSLYSFLDLILTPIFFSRWPCLPRNGRPTQIVVYFFIVSKTPPLCASSYDHGCLSASSRFRKLRTSTPLLCPLHPSKLDRVLHGCFLYFFSSRFFFSHLFSFFPSWPEDATSLTNRQRWFKAYLTCLSSNVTQLTTLKCIMPYM